MPSFLALALESLIFIVLVCIKNGSCQDSILSPNTFSSVFEGDSRLISRRTVAPNKDCFSQPALQVNCGHVTEFSWAVRGNDG